MEQKLINYIIWYSIFLSVYCVSNFYIFIHGWQALSSVSWLRIPYTAIFLSASLSYFMARIIEKYSICQASSIFFWAGSFWFGFMLYFFIIIIIVDIVKVINLTAHFLPESSTYAYQQIKLTIFVFAIMITGVIHIAGFFHAKNYRTNDFEITIPKNGGQMSSLRIALVTDIHMGTIISNSRLDRMVALINEKNPDIVLLGGDMVDEDVGPVIEKNMGKILKNLKSRYGTYAITGNHEYYGSIQETLDYLSSQGITILRDRTVKIGGSFFLAGRDDKTKELMGIEKCRPLKEILRGVDSNYPIILMDHNPLRLKEARENGVDLSLSGHTHHGQMWPLNYITDMIFEISHGYKKISGTHFYVSTGFGTWGPPIRLATRADIAIITVRFTGLQ